MGSLSIWHWIIVLVIIMLLFGKGKIPGLMGDMAKGVKAFKQGLKEDSDSPAAPSKALHGDVAAPTAAQGEKVKDRSIDG